MAEFGIQATQLAPPQGAGSQPIQPVQEQYVNDSILNNPAASNIVDIFAKGLQQNRKEEATARNDAIVGGYVKEETAINNAVATGQLSPSAAAARSRANANKYYAGYPGLIGDFEKAGKALRGFTETGEVEAALATEKKIKEKDIMDASSSGFNFLPSMNEEAVQAQIRAHKTNVRAENETKQRYAANAEARAQGTFDAAAADRDNRENSLKLLNNIAGDNMAAFQAFGVTLADDVKTGKRTMEQAQILLTERFSNIGSALTSAASANPELGGPYKQLFNEANDLFKKMLDPKVAAENLDNELKIITNRMKITAYSDPKFAALATVSNILGNNPSLTFLSSSATTDTVARLSQLTGAGGPNSYVPQVVGNPDVESGTVKILKGAILQLSDPKTRNADKQKLEVETSVNNLLKQTSEKLNLGASPDQLKGMADFFSSSEYATMVNSKGISKEAAQAAGKTFDMLYQPTIVQGVQEKLQGYLNTVGTTKFTTSRVPEYVPVDKPKLAKDAINITFTGGGIVFSAKNMENMSREELIEQRGRIAELNTAQKGVNQLLRIGAHMQGSTDYQAVWEQNKHIYLPTMFSKYEGREIGDIKAGPDGNYRFVGPNNDAKGWVKID